MATLATLESDGQIVQIDVSLDRREHVWRCLYGTPEFVQWLDGVLPTMQTTIVGGEVEPSEQIDAVFYEYVIGDHMPMDKRFKKLSCKPEHYVWEFKTLDIRIFGWVPKLDHFICTFGDHKDEIEKWNRYGMYIAKTVYARDHLDLDPPKHVSRKEYRDVLSDA